MAKQTIKALEERLKNLTELRECDAKQIRNLKEMAIKLTADNEALKADKTWLKSIHSDILQATAEMFRNR